MADVLVIDAHDDMREVLGMVLGGEGHRVTSCGSGRDAVVLAGRERFDLALVDLDASEIAGDEVARVVRDLGETAVVMMGGRRQPWKNAALEAGATACLDKPFSRDTLTSLVRSVLRAASSSREGGWPTDVRRLSNEDLRALSRMSSAELDALPFGAIAVDADGRIVEYNAYEQEASSYWGPSVIGMRFADLAPCTVVKGFTQRLERGLRGEKLDAVLRFVFPHHAALSVVSVRLHRSPSSQKLWIFVSKRRGTER